MMSTALKITAAVLALAIGGRLSLDLPGSPVPVTAQTLAVLLVGAFLDPIRAALAIVLYWGAGLVGLPVFADGDSGWAVFAGPSGGYLLGFLPAAVVVSLGVRRRPSQPFARILLWMLAGHAMIFVLGLLGLTRWVSVGNLLEKGFWPFAPGGLLKSVVAAALVVSFRRFFGRDSGPRS